jgi:hypothetical protein
MTFGDASPNKLCRGGGGQFCTFPRQVSANAIEKTTENYARVIAHFGLWPLWSLVKHNG